MEETGLVVPLGDVALDEFGALGGIISIMPITNKLDLYTYLLSSCSNFLPFSASGSPMQTLALFSDFPLANACLSGKGMAMYHTLRLSEREHKPPLGHWRLLNG